MSVQNCQGQPASGIPLLPTKEDQLTRGIVDTIIVIAPHLARAVRLGWEAATPSTFPVALLPLALPHGLFGSLECSLMVRCHPDDHTAIQVGVMCPDFPDVILSRSDNLSAALKEYYEGDFTTSCTPEGTLLFTLPTAEYTNEDDG